MHKEALQFNISPLLKQGTGSREIYSFEGPYEFDGIEGQSDVKGKVEIMRIEDGVNAKIQDVTFDVTFRCDRCLKKFSKTIRVPFAERQYFLDPPVRPGDPNDIFLINKKNESIDLTEPLRQEIILHFPIIPVCSDSCRGLCPVCGKDKNSGECGCETQPSEIKPLAELKRLIK